MRFIVVLPVIIAGGLALSSCLEVPQAPADDRPHPSFQIALLRDDDTSYALQASPGSEIRLHASVTPAEAADHLQFEWFQGTDSVGSGQTTEHYTVDARQTGIRNMELRVSDREGNREQLLFHLRVGNAPVFPDGKLFQPAPGETLWVAEHENIHFSWSTHDAQLADTLSHIWELRSSSPDSALLSLSTGTLTEVDYADLRSGDYRYRVLVHDPMDLADTSAWIAFHVRERTHP